MIHVEEMPQANNLDDVINTVIGVSLGFSSDEKIAEYLNKGSARQGRYYRKSAVQLGFLENKGNESVITKLGKEFLQTREVNLSLSENIIIKQILEIRPIDLVVDFIIDNPNCTRKELLSFVDRKIDGSFETKQRRLSSIIQWLKTLNLISEINSGYNVNHNSISGGKVDISLTNNLPYITDLLSALRSSSVHSVVTEVTSLKQPSKIQDILYVETKLDEYLINELSRKGDDRWDLVVLAGNAGEGKSALIKKIYKSLDNKNLKINWDATHSDNPKEDQIDILTDFFKPFSDQNSEKRPKDSHLIAMNTGMIISFFEKVNLADHSATFETLYQLLKYKLELTDTIKKESSWRVLLVNLDHRSLLSDSDNEESLLKKMINKLDIADPTSYLYESYNEHCSNCIYKEKCPILFNLKSLQLNNVNESLQKLLLRVTFEEDLHLTPRILWDFIYQIIIGNQEKQGKKLTSCQDDIEKTEVNLDKIGHNLFFQYIFSNNNENDLLQLVKKYDPILVSSQKLDNIATQLAVQPKLDDVSDLDFGKELIKDIRDNVNSELPDKSIEYALFVLRRKYFYSKDQEIIESFQSSIKLLDQYDELIEEYIRYSLDNSYSSDYEYPRIIDLIDEKIPKALQASFGNGDDEELFKIDDLRRTNKHQILVKLKQDYTILPKKHNFYTDSGFYEALNYRPREVIVVFSGENPNEIYGELVINYGLFKLFNLISQGYIPSSIDLNRFFHFRFFSKQLFNQLAKSVSNYMLVEDKLNGKQFFIESPKTKLQKKFKVGEIV